MDNNIAVQLRLGKSIHGIWTALNNYYNNYEKIDQELCDLIRKLPYVQDARDLGNFKIMRDKVEDIASTVEGLGFAYCRRADCSYV